MRGLSVTIQSLTMMQSLAFHNHTLEALINVDHNTISIFQKKTGMRTTITSEHLKKKCSFR